jgi:GAF domain-containing protein
MSTNNESTGPVAALILPELSKPLLTFARAVHGALRDNPAFPSPNPPLDVFAADIAAFEDAETKAASRAKGAASLRDAKKKKVKEDLFHLRDYVQSVVETDTSPAAATALIESAFMSVRKAPKRTSSELSAKNADVSGKALLTAKAVAPVAVYSWEHSLDQSAWTRLPETMRTRTEVADLTSAQVYYFRFRAFTRAGWQDYSPVVSLLVHFAHLLVLHDLLLDELAGFVLVQVCPLGERHPRSDSRLGETARRTFVEALAVRSCANLPLVLGGDVLGLLGVNHRARHVHTPAEIRLLSFIAQVTAIALSTIESREGEPARPARWRGSTRPTRRHPTGANENGRLRNSRARGLSIRHLRSIPCE